MATSHMTTAAFSAIVVVMLLSSAVAAQSSGDVGGKKPKPTDFMVQSCKSASNYSREYNEGIYYYVTPEFCITTLQSDHRSADAKDPRDLALIPVGILKQRVATAGGNVKGMLHGTKNSTSPTARQLRICEMQYAAAASLLTFCDALMRDYQGDDRRGDEGDHMDRPLDFELFDCVDTLFQASGYCWFALPHIPGAEALAKENEGLQMLTSLSVSLLSPYQ